MSAQEEFIATLLHPDEYARNFNRVARLTAQNILFLKRKFVSTAGWELVAYPMSECRSIAYKTDRPVLKIAFGALLAGLTVFVFFMLYVYWDRLEAGTRVPIGLVGLGGLYGIRLAFGARRHRFIFTLANATLTWASRSGEYEYKQASVDKVIAFARSRGLLEKG